MPDAAPPARTAPAIPVPDAEVERALVVTAHPDDVDFGAAGTVAAWTKAGIEVSYCILTDGDAGGFDPAVDRADIPRIRRAEQTAAAAAVGVTDVHFCGWGDGRLTASLDVRRDISRQIRRVQPQRVLCQSPEYNYARLGASHPDHRAAGEAALCAVYPDARNPFAHTELLGDEGLEAWVVPEIWVMAAPQHLLSHWVDVTETFDAKIEALQAHRSQLAEPEKVRDFVGEWLRGQAAAAGLPEGRLAEAFQILRVG